MAIGLRGGKEAVSNKRRMFREKGDGQPKDVLKKKFHQRGKSLPQTVKS